MIDPHDMPGAAVTGHRGVDSALARLDALADLPAEAHVDVYEEIHAALQDALQGAAPHASAGQEAAGHPR